MNCVKILCLVVTHNGAETVRETLQSILRQSVPPSKILLIDNASTDNTIGIVRSLNVQNLEISILEENAGVGRAFNLGIEAAAKQGFGWLWIFDQDTICQEDCLESLLYAGNMLDEPAKPVGALFPSAKSKSYPEVTLLPYHWNGKNFIHASGGHSEDPYLQIHSSISSGGLYKVDVLRQTGGFREDYFIDFVDHDYHLKLHQAGYQMFWVKPATILHELGEAKKTQNGEILFIHNPFRYYYMGRNMTNGYWRLGGAVSVLIFWKDAWQQVKRFKKAGLLPQHAIRYFLRGVLDAFRNKFGALNKH